MKNQLSLHLKIIQSTSDGMVLLSSLLIILMLSGACGFSGGAENPDSGKTDISGTISTIPEDISATGDIILNFEEIEGADTMRIVQRPGDIRESDWIPYQSRITMQLEGEDGNKTIDVQFRNRLGAFLHLSTGIYLARNPPEGFFTVNRGAYYTDSVEVRLFMDNISGAESMRFRNEYSDTGDETRYENGWEAFQLQRDWILEDREGDHVVHGEFIDGLGRIHKSRAEINLSRSAPGGEFTINGGSRYTNNPERIVSLDFSAITNASEFRIANENESPEDKDWEDTVLEMTWTLSEGEGEKIIRAEFRSPSGLTNTLQSSIIYDITPPDAPLVMAPERTGSRSPVWVFESEGASLYRVIFEEIVYEVESTEASFTPPASLEMCNKSWSLNVKAIDGAGNISPETESAVFVYCMVGGSVSLHDPEGGDLFIILLNREEYSIGEMETDAERWSVVPASDPRFVFEDVSCGEWIILGFQDNDGNEELTLGLFGAPREPWGTYAGESWASLISFDAGHFVVDRDGRSEILLRLSGFTL